MSSTPFTLQRARLVRAATAYALPGASRESPRGGARRVWYEMSRAKLHRLTVTEAALDYEGSITLDEALLEASGILPLEIVQVTSLANGTLWRTYVIPGPSHSGIVCLNGPPARHFHPGDRVIVVSHGLYTAADLAQLVQRVVFVDDANRILRVEEHRLPVHRRP